MNPRASIAVAAAALLIGPLAPALRAQDAEVRPDPAGAAVTNHCPCSGGAAGCNPLVMQDSATILAWTPDCVDPLNRTAVDLAPRGRSAPGPTDARMIVGLDNGAWVYWDRADGVAQGGPIGNVYAFSHWQYVDLLYYYDHVALAIPPVQWRNAAHRNGVPIVAVLTADCPTCGDAHARVLNELFASPANTRKTAEVLASMAQAYGFDGWLFDIEHGFPAAAVRNNVMAVMSCLRGRKAPHGECGLADPPLTVAGYEGGVVEIVSAAPFYWFEHTDVWQSDYAHCCVERNCARDPERACPQPKDSAEILAKQSNFASQDRNPLDFYWTDWVYDYHKGPLIPGETILDNGKSVLRLTSLMLSQSAARAEDGSFTTSLGLYAPAWSLFGGSQKATDQLPPRDTFRRLEQQLWVGDPPQGPDCSTLGGADAVSSFVTPRSVVNRLPFSTNFNHGEGDSFWLQGRQVDGRAWNNLSAQDVLPTWTCRLDRAGPRLTTTFQEAWEGGSALRLAGRLPPGGVTYALYAADAPIPPDTVAGLRFRCAAGNGPPELVLAFESGGSSRVRGECRGNGWQVATGPVAAKSGDRLERISVHFANPLAGDQMVATVVGRVEIGSADLPRPAMIRPASGAVGERVVWTAPPGDIDHYDVFQVVRSEEPPCLTFAGRAFATEYELRTSLYPVRKGLDYLVQPVGLATRAELRPELCAERARP